MCEEAKQSGKGAKRKRKRAIRSKGANKMSKEKEGVEPLQIKGANRSNKGAMQRCKEKE